jgi:uncharacterized short protein YbdD (DUF466 family)
MKCLIQNLTCYRRMKMLVGLEGFSVYKEHLKCRNEGQRCL